IAKNISEEKAVLLLQDVYQSCKKRNEIDTAIGLLKLILQDDARDNLARREITECYRVKYAAHSQLEEYIRISNLTQTWRNVREAITDFEKHIAFDRGSFVFHRTWGVGRISSIQGDDIVVDFAKKRAHSMSLKMAVNALQTLSKNHIWVLKATQKKEKLHDRVKDEVSWALKTVIKSFGNSCDIKRIKAELVPSVLSAGEWTGWSSKAREILKSDPGFGVAPDNIDLFTVRDRPISLEEKLYNEFKAERNFFDRIATIRAYEAQTEAELDSEFFNEMFSYFSAFLRSYTQVNEQVIASWLLARDLGLRHPRLAVNLPDFAELFSRIDDLSGLFLNLKDSKLREEFLHQIKLVIPRWDDIYVRLFPHAMLPSIIANLEKEGCDDKIAQMIQNCYENYRDNREAVVWFFRNAKKNSWFEKAGISLEKRIITLIYILDISYRDIDNHRETTENRKINKQVYTLLFKDGVLESLIRNAGGDTLLRIYTLIEDVKDIDPADKLKLRSIIQERDPHFKFADTEKKTSRALLATASKYEEKKQQLARLMDVEVPANSKEIAFALSLGDLRENAEYKAAKERQDILNSTITKLKDEIERAQIFDPATASTERVSFGTTVVLENSSGAEETYTILGPWESDPENHIISYLSPFGGAMVNKQLGEQFDFIFDQSHKEDRISYIVKSIEKARVG
ncbi:MAG: transcription elongation factor GreA, partial [Treponema sp.]|nr:transcription elongation factor GreA [Treponema sp.]